MTRSNEQRHGLRKESDAQEIDQLRQHGADAVGMERSKRHEDETDEPAIPLIARRAEELADQDLPRTDGGNTLEIERPVHHLRAHRNRRGGRRDKSGEKQLHAQEDEQVDFVPRRFPRATVDFLGARPVHQPNAAGRQKYEITDRRHEEPAATVLHAKRADDDGVVPEVETHGLLNRCRWQIVGYKCQDVLCPEILM